MREVIDGGRVRELRSAIGLSQGRFADLVGVSSYTVQRIERTGAVAVLPATARRLETVLSRLHRRMVVLGPRTA